MLSTKQRVAFASDYDGTLVEGVDRMRPEDVAAIRRFQQAGGLFGACSGRALNCVLEPAEKNAFDLDFIVASTGSVIVIGGKVVESHPLADDVARGLVSEFRGERMGLHALSRFVVNFGPTSPNQTKVDSLEDFLDGRRNEQVYAMSVNFGDEGKAQEAVRRVSGRFGASVMAFQNVGSIDIVPLGCSKGRGLRTARDLLGADLMGGIGDSYNDIPLLLAADVAYTFHTSPLEVRRQADVLVDSVADAVGDFWKRR